jgi:hypothetical protein
MFLKSLTVILFAAAIAMSLIYLRHQRLEMMNEMTRLHSQMNHSRQDVWDLQERIATKSQPAGLAAAITRTKLQLEPLTAGSNAAPQGIAISTVSIPRVAEVNGKFVIKAAKAPATQAQATPISIHATTH